jgi:hypothetical protein
MAELRDDPHWHAGRRIIEKDSRGGVLVLCPLRHLVGYVPAGEWAGSPAERDAAKAVECVGAPIADETF